MMGAMMLAMASCATDPKDPFEGDNNPGNETPEVTEVAPGVYTFMAANNSRISHVLDGTWVATPEHKYSATGIAFGDDGYVYVCWHSNRAMDKDEEENYEHGTNVGEDGSEPSLDNAEDWGGIIDVFKVDASGNWECVQTLVNTEHKYNHVLYNGGKLYLTSTSNRLGAALDVITLNNGELPSEDGYYGADSYRINLTGYSANCVEIVKGKLVTISGRKVGGINWFDVPLTWEDVIDQTKEAISGDTENFGGKHLCYDGTYVYALSDKDYKGVITKYDENGTVVDDPFEILDEINAYFTANDLTPANAERALVPKDGKNGISYQKTALTVVEEDGSFTTAEEDTEILYVSCGRNAFHAFDLATGKRVGGSNKHANSCDVAEYSGHEYVFIATGDGLAVLDPQELEIEYKKDDNGKWIRYTQADADAQLIPNKISEDSKDSKNPHNLGVGDRKEFLTGNFKTVKYVQYDGTGSYDEADVPEGVKESANFVKVHDGKVFVAYGMYGLHIYDLESLFSEANDEVVEPDNE